MSEAIVFGALRLLRLFVGLYAGWAGLGVLLSLPALFHLHDAPGRALIWLISLCVFLLACAVFVGLRALINGMHRASFGAPHPRLRSHFSL